MALNKQQLTLVSGLGLGAGLMYLLDPQGGGRRRALVRDKAVSAYNTSSDVMRKTSRDLGNRSKGLTAGVRSKLSQGEVDDLKLCERVRSKMGRVVSHPGSIEVTAENGVVRLHGDVLASEADALLSCVRAVKGVQDVESHLNVQAEADNVPSLQGEGRLQAARKWGGPAARVLAGTAGAGLAVAGAKRRDKIGAALGAVGLGLLAGSGAGQRLLALRHRGNGSPESLQNEESNSSLQAGSVTVNELEAPFATLGDTEAASELRGVTEGSSPESHIH